jgi:hypothetical protein
MRWFLEKDKRQKECSRLAMSEDEKRRRAIMDNLNQYGVGVAVAVAVAVGVGVGVGHRIVHVP